MEMPKCLWTGMVVLSAGDAFYAVAIFGGYAAMSDFCPPLRQAA
jgi:hypothetical protein